MTSPASYGSLKKNYFFSAFSAVMGIAYPIFTMAYVARVLGPQSLGKYYFANSLAAYFLLVASLGIPAYGSREASRARENPGALRKVFSELFAINFLSSFLIAAVYGLLVASVPSLRAEARLFGVLALLFLGSAFTCDFLFSALERQDLIAYRSLISKVVSIVLILVLVRAPEDYVVFAAIVAIGAVINAALGLGSLRYWNGWRSLSLPALTRHVRPLFHLVVATLFINIYVTLDSVILGLLSNAHEVGLYGAVMRPCRLFSILVSSLIVVSMPRLAFYFETGEHGNEWRELQKKSLDMILLLCVPATAAMIAIPETIIRIVYGPEFVEAAFALRVAGVLAVISGLSTFYVYQVLLPLGKERTLLPMAIASAVASVGLNLLLIPRLGHLGAVWAAVAAETVSTGMMIFIALRMTRGYVAGFGQSWKYVVAGGALAAVLALAPSKGIFAALGAGGALSLLAYGAVLWVLRERFSRQAAAAAFARLSRR